MMMMVAISVLDGSGGFEDLVRYSYIVLSDIVLEEVSGFVEV
jgi:hypothetical protein